VCVEKETIITIIARLQRMKIMKFKETVEKFKSL
jgi:hypothetical protein